MVFDGHDNEAVAFDAVGLEDDVVRVVDYHPAWPSVFDALAEPLRRHLPDSRIEHVGSTSVPGLAAKPLIDISVGLPTGGSLAVAAAQACGLEFRAVNPESVLFAVFGRPGFRLANVHVRYVDAESERWDILFRDFLRAHPSLAQRYGETKRAAAATVDGLGRSRYSETKAPFIKSLTPEIEAWASGSA